MARKRGSVETPAPREIPLTSTTRVAAKWARYWFAGFDPDGAPPPWPRRVTSGSARVQWTDAFGAVQAGALAWDESAAGPECNPFQLVRRDYDGLHELVPASRIFIEGDLKTTPCATCAGRPPDGFICGTCGERGSPM